MIFPFRLDRARRAAEGSRLEWKVRLFSIGAALALAGMILRVRWLVTLALPVLLVGALLRFLPRGEGEDASPD